MPLNAALLRKMISRQRSWKREDVYDAVFALKLLLAVVTGGVCGTYKLEGFYVLAAFVLATFAVANIWFNFQGINVDEIDGDVGEAAAQSLVTEGLGQSMPLFLVSESDHIYIQYSAVCIMKIDFVPRPSAARMDYNIYSCIMKEKSCV